VSPTPTLMPFFQGLGGKFYSEPSGQRLAPIFIVPRLCLAVQRECLQTATGGRGIGASMLRDYGRRGRV
jgi:hypothetical protein